MFVLVTIKALFILEQLQIGYSCSNLLIGNLEIIFANYLVNNFSINQALDSLLANQLFFFKRELIAEDRLHLAFQVGEGALIGLQIDFGVVDYCDVSLATSAEVEADAPESKRNYQCTDNNAGYPTRRFISNLS